MADKPQQHPDPDTPDTPERSQGVGQRKTESADLRKQYPIYAQIGMVIALGILILAFQANLQQEGDFEVVLEEQETVDIEEIEQTQQEEEPPPPPRPPVPEVVPDDEIIDDEEIDWDMSIDPDEALDTGGPPQEEEEDDEDEVFVVVEDQPELIGGMEALQNEVDYPDFARQAGIEGTVFVEFVVNPQGQVEDPQVTRGVHRLLDEEAVRAVSQMEFEPGMQRGEAVYVQMSLPVRFQLQ